MPHLPRTPVQTRTFESYSREWSQAELQMVRFAQMEAVRTGRVSAAAAMCLGHAFSAVGWHAVVSKVWIGAW